MLNMRLNEIESIELNKVKDEVQVDSLVKKCKDGLVIENVKDAKKTIKEFVAIVIGKDFQLAKKNDKIKKLNLNQEVEVESRSRS